MQLKNIKVINKDKIIENADIEIIDGVITKITAKEGKASSIVIPGFIDTHTHGFAGYDAMDGIEAVEMISKELKKFGTTSYLSTVMTESWEKIINSLKDSASAKSVGSRILGIHLEGPFISIQKKGAHNEKFIIKPTEQKIRELQKAANGMIMKMTIAPEVMKKKLYAILKEEGIIPTIGHSNADALDAHDAINYGATACTHLWNAMSGVQNRNPGIASTILQRSEVYAELICDFIHVDEETIHLSINTKGVDRIVAITDSIRPAGLPDGESTSGGLDIIKKGSLITLKGSDVIAGSGATMYDNFKNLIKLGYTLQEVVSMTSTNAAENLRVTNLGKVKEGYMADLVVLDFDLNIKQVLVNGE